MNTEIYDTLKKALDEVMEKHGVIIDRLDVEWERTRDQGQEHDKYIFKRLGITGYCL